MYSVSAEDVVCVLALHGVSVRTVSVLPWIYRLREAEMDLSSLDLHEMPSEGLVSIPVDRVIEVLENRSYSLNGVLTARGIDYLEIHLRALMAAHPEMGSALEGALGFDLGRWRPKLGLERLMSALVVVVGRLRRDFASSPEAGRFDEYVTSQLGISKGEASTLVNRAGLCPKTGEAT